MLVEQLTALNHSMKNTAGCFHDELNTEHSTQMVNPALLNSGFMAVFSSSQGLLSDGLQFQNIHMLQLVKETNMDLTEAERKWLL